MKSIAKLALEAFLKEAEIGIPDECMALAEQAMAKIIAGTVGATFDTATAAAATLQGNSQGNSIFSSPFWRN